MASRRKPYSLSALRNSVSFCVKARMMRSTFSGAPERLTTDGDAEAAGVVCAEAEAEHIVAAARTDKRTLFIDTFPKLKGRRARHSESGSKRPPSNHFDAGFKLKVAGSKLKVQAAALSALSVEPA